ncbi:helix-turn-helix domain-containing protein [Serratia odorifera]|uniref:Transcriptional regulator, AraC family n=2 Tax=Serratia odorifera TaxID=618 RepID=D4E2L0_SEROD|nr:AraC family transcriptional regulator [Serratia odorifera]EFE95972.1 transcriptional regulator, AraC family [Serratia odorifera DSM 4582]PNK90584.1 AraC family transcriptional regulator [Serratia odorifera]RII71667.1 AraC family transcriptional regulator [Serratia odorifera]VDZ58989.1 L-rhamnose operon transcriptional activator rhaR [Serratia odorifera]
MPLIPLTFVFAAVYLALLIRLGAPQRQRWVFHLLLLLCIWQSLLVGVRYGYHFNQFNALQPYGAIAIPALIYLALTASAQGGRWHYGLVVAMPLAIAGWAQLWAPWLLDGLIIAAYLGFALAMLLFLRQGENSLPRVALTESWLSLRLWRALGMLLLAGGLAETAIAWDFAFHAGEHAGAIATLSSLLVVLGLGAILLRAHLPAHTVEEPPVEAEQHKPTEEWFALIERRLRQDGLYLDAELNLTRLARKVGLPARKVSQAINQHAGMNVSQYVNQMRIHQAAHWLSASDRPITDIMLEAGFTTKSNFNREFQRIWGLNPSEWRKRHALAKQ